MDIIIVGSDAVAQGLACSGVSATIVLPIEVDGARILVIFVHEGFVGENGLQLLKSLALPFN
jgi:hypothetical protein